MIVVDIETSGVDPIKNSILSIGAVDFLNPKRIFYEECRAFEGAHISDESLAVNGYSREEVTDSQKQSDKEIVEHFLAWTLESKDHTMAGQNPSFDRDFIMYTAQRYHLNWPLTHRTVDLHSVCYSHMVGQGTLPPMEKNRSALNLDAILVYLGMPEVHDSKLNVFQGFFTENFSFQSTKPSRFLGFLIKRPKRAVYSQKCQIYGLTK